MFLFYNIHHCCPLDLSLCDKKLLTKRVEDPIIVNQLTRNIIKVTDGID